MRQRQNAPIFVALAAIAVVLVLPVQAMVQAANALFQAAIPEPSPMHAPWPADNEWDNTLGSAWHKGTDEYAIDFNAPGGANADEGDIVLSVADGLVLTATVGTCPDTGYGCQVVVGHPLGFETRYGHLTKTLVTQGASVTQGEPIGLLGTTGNSTAPHLHFSVYYCEDASYATNLGALCSKPLQSVVPLLWDKSADSLVAVDSSRSTVNSGAFGVGYEKITDLKDPSKLVFHESFSKTYHFFGGQSWVFGLAKTPVETWAGALTQEFGLYKNPNVSWSDLSSALIETEGTAHLILGPIWDEYKRDNGPQGKWGNPTTHSYEWELPAADAFRNDFANGSIIWIKQGGRFEYLDASNAPWIGNFFDKPNSFTGTSVQRRDKYLDFKWPPLSAAGPVINYDGFSAIWGTTEYGLIGVTRIVAPAVQGHLEVKINGKLVLKADSPDQEQKFESPLKLGLGAQHIEVRFWQESGKGARLWLTTAGIIPPVFASDGMITSGYPPIPQAEFSNYAPPPFPDGSTPPTPSAATATMLVLDVSGSMSESWHGGVKIESAKSAANQIANMLQQESQVSSMAHRLGLATFTTDAFLNLPLTSDYNLARSAINGLIPLDSTNIGAGLTVANQALGQASGNESKVVILLSDGLTNTGLPADQILAGPVQEAVNAGTCIYTIGFGDPGSFDEDLLRRIAAASGCGQYYYATDVNELQKIYIRVRHVSTGSLLAELSGTVAQGQTVQAGTFDVPTGQDELAVSLNWPGSALDLQLTDPQGKVVDQTYPGANIASYSNLVYALIQKPISGTWQVAVYGREVPEGTSIFDALASVRPSPVLPTPEPTQPPPAPTATLPTSSPGPAIVVMLAVIAAGGIGVYALVKRQPKRASLTSGAKQGLASLVFTSGALAGRTTSIPTSGLVIGRGSACNLRLDDPVVSRQHARIRHATGAWFIQDLNSSGGTFVNGQRVQATRLNSGDQIQIGSSVFMFGLNG